MKTNVLILSIASLAICIGCSQKDIHQAPEKNPQQDSQTQNMDEGMLPFNSENLKKYKGHITELFNIRGPYGQSDVIGLLLQTDKGGIPVQLGPSSFVLNGPVALRPGLEVEVRGSEYYMEGRIYIIAEYIKIKGYVLKLRDEQGQPLWTGWKKD